MDSQFGNTIDRRDRKKGSSLSLGILFVLVTNLSFHLTESYIIAIIPC